MSADRELPPNHPLERRRRAERGFQVLQRLEDRRIRRIARQEARRVIRRADFGRTVADDAR